MNLFNDGRHFTPETGKRYTNVNGTVYECRAGLQEDLFDDGTAWFVSPKGWAFKAINCVMYPDGTIEWDYSKHGHWINPQCAGA